MFKKGKTVMGNWKMNCSLPEAKKLAKDLANYKGDCRVAICPPAAFISEVSKALEKSKIILGAQDSHFEEKGAFTGDISPYQLFDCGARVVILGHSERRTSHFETSEIVSKKALSAIKAGLAPCVCVGENKQERESGKSETIVVSQLRASLQGLKDFATDGGILLAYEPIWAIGSGKPATLKDILAMHRALLEEAGHVLGFYPPVLYGGSVTSEIAKDFSGHDTIGGFLVGGASLKAEEFLKIAKAFD